MGQTKNILLVSGFFILVFISYHYAFSKTLALKGDLENLKDQIRQNSQLQKRSANLIQNESFLDSIINKNREGNISLQNNLLKVLNKFSKEYSYEIISFKEPHLLSLDENSYITSFQFTLEGEYLNLEKLLYKLETDYSFGSLSHVNFEKTKDFRKNKSFLQCTVIIQNKH